MPSFSPVTATLRGIDVLAAVNALGEASVSQIHKRIGLNMPTVVRMLETLQHAGYVVKHGDRPVYTATARTLALSVGYAPQRELVAVAAPIMAQLNADVGWPSDLAIYDGEAMLVLQTSRGEGRLSFNRRPGYRAPLLATSLGCAWLAACPPDERQRALEQVVDSPDPWNDVARDPERAEALFAEITTKGYASMHDAYSAREYGGRLWAIGTVVLADGEPIAALNMMLVRTGAETESSTELFATSLRGAAEKIGAAIALARAGTDRKAPSQSPGSFVPPYDASAPGFDRS